MDHKCPSCGSLIYSRRNVLCGVCGGRLPDSVLFSPEEREAVDRELEAMRQRRSREHRAKNDGSSSGWWVGDSGTSDGFGGGSDGGGCGGGE